MNLDKKIVKKLTNFDVPESMPTQSYIPLPEFGLMQVSGKQAAQFLQGQLTCDVSEVTATQSCLGALCDIKGRVHATFQLLFYHGAYYFLLPHCMVAHLMQCLQKYAVFSAVQLADVTGHWHIVGVMGSDVASLLQEQHLLPQLDCGAAVTSDQGISLRLAGSPARFVLLLEQRQSLSFIDASLPKGTVEVWQVCDIAAGIPTVYPQTQAQFTPQQLNYPAIGGVSFNKGCYLGQEIIARTHYLGQAKSRLYRMAFQARDSVLPGTPVCNGDNELQGTVINCAKERENSYQALICLQNQAISHTIYLNDSKGPILKRLELPYTV